MLSLGLSYGTWPRPGLGQLLRQDLLLSPMLAEGHFHLSQGDNDADNAVVTDLP
jgi:hypothetical protein